MLDCPLPNQPASPLPDRSEEGAVPPHDSTGSAIPHSLPASPDVVPSRFSTYDRGQIEGIRAADFKPTSTSERRSSNRSHRLIQTRG